MRTLPALCATLLISGCGQAAPRPAPAPVVDAGSGWTTSPGYDIGGGGGLYDDSGRPLTSSTVTFEHDPGRDRFETTTIGGAGATAAPRPRRVGKRDVFFKGARLDNALRMLAREGRFNLVVQGDLSDVVTLELRGVEPYDAARVLAEVNHLTLRFRDGIVIVAGGATK